MAGNENSQLIRFPDFLCIGAQKGGTTWLQAMLRRHPGVWMPELKELQYFNQLYIPEHGRWIPEHRDLHVARVRAELLSKNPEGKLESATAERLEMLAQSEVSDEWYGRLFAQAGADQVCGELTPEYSLLPDEGIAHVIRLNPRVKIIFMVRDPIDRAWSHMRMLTRQRNKTADPDAVLKYYFGPDVLDRCDYPSIMKKWISFVGRDSFLLLNYDDLASKPGELLGEVHKFLGVEQRPLDSKTLLQRIHEGEHINVPPAILDELKKALRPVYMDSYPELAPILASWAAKHYSDELGSGGHSA